MSAMARSEREAKRKRVLRLLLHDPRALDVLERLAADPRFLALLSEAFAAAARQAEEQQRVTDRDPGWEF